MNATASNCATALVRVIEAATVIYAVQAPGRRIRLLHCIHGSVLLHIAHAITHLFQGILELALTGLRYHHRKSTLGRMAPPHSVSPSALQSYTDIINVRVTGCWIQAKDPRKDGFFLRQDPEAR
eukprot:CAMPEP_0115469426 /NCGR_PEP_ID=MMETSP0271-20121206/51474_1 /TAXON_ID=71861 /ORGANISM="Scrippsiella trochoidea, Strain CCMP3099" /LENGTH=123 /DNA_ID=CAMNT_0002896525 /DNA_START=74 /DNA_END=445 /DNA_ORIENTATION=+